MKAFETPEEKRARRLAKKEAKERKKREKMGWGEEYMGYTNTDNPFGDNNLLGTFIWNKVSLGQPGWALSPAHVACQSFLPFASYTGYSLFPKTLFSIPSACAQIVPATDIVCRHEHTHQLPPASPLMTLSCGVKFQALHPQNQPNLRQNGRTGSQHHLQGGIPWSGQSSMMLEWTEPILQATVLQAAESLSLTPHISRAGASAWWVPTW